MDTESAKELTLAFAMCTHQRLGTQSLFFTVDDGIIRMIGERLQQEALHNRICTQDLQILLGNCKDERLRSMVCNMVAGPDSPIQGRLLEKSDVDLLDAGSKVENKPNKNLMDIVWDVRTRVQAHLERGHTLAYCEERHDDLVFYIELDEGCKLLRADDVEEEQCNLCHDFDVEDSEDEETAAACEGWNYPAHVFSSFGEAMDVDMHISDLLGHIGKKNHAEKLASLISEAFILQACRFPISNESTKVGNGGLDAWFAGHYEVPCYEMFMFVTLCHEYETDLRDFKRRMRSDMRVDMHVHKYGRIVRLRYSWHGNEECDNCECKWCTSFLTRGVIDI